MTPMLAAMVLATPLFGFSLTPPDMVALSPDLSGVPAFAQIDAAGGAEDGEADDADADGAEEEAGGGSAAESDVSPRGAVAPAADVAPAPGPSDAAQLGALLRQRQEIGAVHRAFGIATWASMLVTVALGMIQYVNLYGFFGSREDTPCVNGSAVFGQDQCWGTPWVHRIAAMTTTVLYSTTFVLSFVMPDPLGADQGRNAEDLRLHKVLRWVHLGGMIAQVLLGFAVGQNWFGLDRANDFDAMQALATVHQVIGLATFGTLSAAAAIMVF